MILKNHVSIQKPLTSSLNLKKVGLISLVCVCLIAFIAFCYIVYEKLTETPMPLAKPVEMTLIGDAEVAEGHELVLGNYRLHGGHNQSKDYAYQGSHSLKLKSPEQLYGFTLILKDIQVGDSLVASVWVHAPNGGSGSLVISGLTAEELYVQVNSSDALSNWQLITVSALIDKPLQNNTAKIYCFCTNPEAVYFDNISFGRNNSEVRPNQSEWVPENIDLFVKDEEFEKLKAKREEAIQQGLLVNTDDSWVNGYIYPKNDKEEHLKVSLRLKGDWTDHLQGDQWSFRVQTRIDQSWNRLKVFSLQNPATRSYLYEWTMHQFFLYEDLLTTRYEFINMQLNHKDLGIYVYEEHFLKQIPESNRKKEGPIVRFVEGSYWESYLQTKRLGADDLTYEYLGTPDIKPFLESKTAKTPVLAEQFVIAQNLLYEYQYGLKPADEIFDIDLLAKYYAIIDLTGGYHGMAWHNQRFYYNPSTSKLEPIGFDGFGNNDLNDIPAEPFLGSKLCHLSDKRDWHAKLFNDETFVSKYLFFLEQFSKEEYLRKFITSINQGLSERSQFIKKYKPDYAFDANYMIKRGKNILNILYPHSQSLLNKTVKPGLIAVCNRQNVPLKIIGSATQDQGSITSLDSSEVVFTTPHYDLPDYSKHIAVPTNANFLVYQVLGLDKIYYSSINQWPVPEAFSPAQQLQPNLQTNHLAYFYIPEKKRVVFRKNAIINEAIVIPKDHDVIIESGSKIDFIKGAFVLSYSNVQFLGTEEAPISITSSDKSAKSFTVIKTKKKSNIEHTSFSDFGAFSYNGWNLPGAINFYEANVDIHYSTFTKNSCEDAINIVRSNFEFDHNTVSHTFGDGFDADFCKGSVTNCYFYKTGNDCIDFSTSNISITDCKMEYSGDKGISIGENGVAYIKNTSINHAVIGVASKDLSKVTIESVTLDNCGVGFAVYEKKPEYGGAFMYVNQYLAQNTPILHKVYPRSYLKLLGKEIFGD